MENAYLIKRRQLKQGVIAKDPPKERQPIPRQSEKKKAQVQDEKKVLPKAAKRIKSRSKKQAAIMKELKKLYKPFLADHDECEIKSTKCTGQVETVHHVKGRAISVVFNQKYWKRSCSACNTEVENSNAWAVENGHKESRHSK